MKGLGRAPVLAALGLAVAIGCGGRTGTLEGEYGEPAGSGGAAVSGTNSGGTNSAGTSHGGTSHGGHAGTSVGGSPVAGAAGAPIGGTFGGYGGYTGGVGGCVGSCTGGYQGGGFGGTFVGGFGGVAGGPPQDCQTCLLDNCSMQLGSCFQDFGCVAIFGCMQLTGCRGPSCYTPQYCKGVIDQNGGPGGIPMTELIKTVTCAFQSGCQCGG